MHDLKNDGVGNLGPELQQFMKWQKRHLRTKGGKILFLAMYAQTKINDKSDDTIVRQKIT